MLLYICDYIVGADIMVNRIHIIDILRLLYPLMMVYYYFLASSIWEQQSFHDD